MLPSENKDNIVKKVKTFESEMEEIDFIYNQQKEEVRGVGEILKKLRERGDLQAGEQIIGRGTDKQQNEFDDQKQKEIKLEYRDEQGRLMTPKEAFRYMCRIFHGKKPSRNNLEKRQKYQNLKD